MTQIIEIIRFIHETLALNNEIDYVLSDTGMWQNVIHRSKFILHVLQT
jgi:hypothetical protein